MSEFLLLSQIAVRNLFSSFLNLVIGGIIFVGTFLFVAGGSVLNSVDQAMSKSITGSVAGHIQVYSDSSKGDLAIFDAWETPDLTEISDFSKIKPALMSIENVKTVIPMGVNSANVMYGNTVDLTLEKLRKAVNTKTKDQIESLKAHVRQIISVIQEDYKKFTIMSSEQAIDHEGVKALEKASSPAFWSDFDRDPLGHLEFMENRIASLVPDADYVFFSYVGTDLDVFQKSFDRMQIVDGKMVPTGQRGMMLSKYVYEEQFKIKIAYRLDKINEAVFVAGKTIAKDPDLQLLIKQNKTQTREIILQLDPLSSEKMVSLLQKFLKSEEKVLPKLLSDFLDTNDANLAERYAFFYKEVAPLIELYRLRPGDSIAIKNFTKSGYIQSVNVKVYGTFQFKGLEKSGLAGGISLMDLMSFRDLYGFLTPERLAETKQLQSSTGLAFVDRDHAEGALFGGASIVENAKEQKIDEKKQLGGVRYVDTAESLSNKAYTQDEIESGMILNAAILLKDPSKINDTMKQITEISKKEGLNLRVVDWQKAAGNIGQFVLVAKIVLYFAVFIIFIVALVIINNAVMMATLQRIREIGTMRAVGAQRSFVLALVIIETAFLGVVFGALGTSLGAIVVKWLGNIGIPAGNEFLYFFFSGPRLYVTLGLGSLIGSMLIITVVTTISALYPAIIATRVSPLQAMQTED